MHKTSEYIHGIKISNQPKTSYPGSLSLLPPGAWAARSPQGEGPGNEVDQATYVSVKSKLKHPPGQPPGHLKFWKIFVQTPNSRGWKARACTSFARYLKVFKNHLYYLWHVRVLSIKPCLHTQLPAHNRSYWKVSRGWGHLITWNGSLMGHLNSFSSSGGRNLNKTFPKIQMPGGLPGWGVDVEASIWLVHYDRELQNENACTAG